MGLGAPIGASRADRVMQQGEAIEPRADLKNGSGDEGVETGSDGRIAYWAVYILLAATVLLVNVFTDPSRFADFDTYVYYLDALVHYPPPNWMYFEVFSNVYLLGSHWLTRSVLTAVVLAHYVLGIIFLLALPVVYPPRRASWPTLLFTFAILGSLLAFVTLRATPAYFLVAISVRHAVDRRPTAWLFLAAASCFHISALLAAPPLALLYFERNLPKLLRSEQSRRYYLSLAIAMIGVAALLPQMSDSLSGLIKSIPVLSKYDVYTEASETTVTRVGHYIFLAFVVLLTAAFMTVQRDASRKLNIFVLVSFALYVLMFFVASPVAAFRQTPFWIMPLISALPWDRLGVRRGTAPVFVLACVVLMVFQFSQVYNRGM